MLLEFCTLNDVAFAKILKKFVKMSPSPQHAAAVREEFAAVLEREAFNEAEVTNKLLAQVMKQYSQSITNGNRQHAAKLLLNSWTNGRSLSYFELAGKTKGEHATANTP